ncbi:MAG: tetraacyldisaccharide 4'-kinase [Chromatiales bacterium 21-64-14]|nr:MAG: tetraacyldisaccharide 4'-kinase [Chromatiales bacterium 21-64-14]
MRLWYGGSPWSWVLAPVGGVYRCVTTVRRWCYRSGLARVHRLSVPVVVVGNLTVGGTGKTPLVVWLADALRGAGFQPGIVLRGYGGCARHWPQQVRADSDPIAVGDEAVLLAQRTGCPVVAAPDRVAAARALLDSTHCDVVLADDGLQHYRLGRDIEIVVVDGVRRFGNGRCLPAGPLREPVGRMRHADFVVVNGGVALGQELGMKLVGAVARNLVDETTRPLETFRGEEAVHGVAGIGDPERFFADLEREGLTLERHPFPDHHPFQAQDLEFGDQHPVLMTEKDAVKCRRYAQGHHWYVPVEAVPDPRFGERLRARLGRIG